MFVAGTIVAGKYRIEHVLGEGGMGVVLAATHVALGTQVALKFLRADMARHASVVERFQREARASAQLRSENVCRVTDVGVLDDGIPYIVMELLTGRDLSSLLKSGGALPPAQIAEYMMQACNAIAEAHALGIIHRDLKPGNLFVSHRPDGKSVIKVLDFGVAKAPTAEQSFSLTQTASVMGSPGYMSPEQLKSSKTADARSDIWSLGVVMYELASARQPFVGESITELALRVAMDPTPQLPTGIPRGFAEVVARCLEKDPAKRYPDVGALAAALAPFALGGAEAAAGITRVLRSTQPQLGPHERTAVSTPTTLGSASGVVDGGPRRRSGVLVSAVTALVVIAVAVTVGVMTRTSGGAAPAPVVGKQPAAPAVSPPPPPPTPPPPTPPVEAAPVAVTPPPPPAAAPPPAAPPRPPVVKAAPPPKKKPTIEDLSESRK